MLLYSLKVCPLTKNGLKLIMELFISNNIDTENICQSQFWSDLLSNVIKKRAIRQLKLGLMDVWSIVKLS